MEQMGDRAIKAPLLCRERTRGFFALLCHQARQRCYLTQCWEGVGGGRVELVKRPHDEQGAGTKQEDSSQQAEQSSPARQAHGVRHGQQPHSHIYIHLQAPCDCSSGECSNISVQHCNSVRTCTSRTICRRHDVLPHLACGGLWPFCIILQAD